MQISIRHIVACRHAQTTAYAVPCPTIGFAFSGLEYMDSPDFHVGPGTTGIFFHAQGHPISFQFNAKRENYAILFESPDVRMSSAPDRGDVRLEGVGVSVPGFVPVVAGRLEGWRQVLVRMRMAFLMPTARNRLRAEVGVYNLLRYLLDEKESGSGTSAAERLKRLIDTANSERQTLDALCAECGYSVDHLRILFEKEFGITPKQYRMRRRMTEAMEWITSSALSPKEIARRLGFAQLSHFSAAFKDAHGMTPREAARRYRGNMEKESPAAPEETPVVLHKEEDIDWSICCPDQT